MKWLCPVIQAVSRIKPVGKAMGVDIKAHIYAINERLKNLGWSSPPLHPGWSCPALYYCLLLPIAQVIMCRTKKCNWDVGVGVIQ